MRRSSLEAAYHALQYPAMGSTIHDVACRAYLSWIIASLLHRAKAESMKTLLKSSHCPISSMRLPRYMDGMPASLAMTASCMIYILLCCALSITSFVHALHAGTRHISICACSFALHGAKPAKGPMSAVRCTRCQKAPAGTLACSLAAASASLGINARNSLSFACTSYQH